ncbi:MAG: type IV pilus modification PilV family protein [Pirellulaceae bacterium]
MTRQRTTGAAARHGISLFEVLVSILVASIGVFGVLVLIPFAVKNAQLGIDREAAINAAKNYYADFQAYGLNSAANTWYDDEGIMPTPHIASLTPTMLNDKDGNPTSIAEGWPYLMDPIGAVSLGTGNFGQFPSHTGMPADLPQINRITISDSSTGTEIQQALANRLSRQADDLVFESPVDELGPPQQAFFEVGTMSEAKRQFKGAYQTVSIMVPEDDVGIQYRMYTIVVKPGDRPTAQERVFEIVDPDNTGARIPKLDTGTVGEREFEQIALGGGDLALSELATPNQPPEDKDAIRNNDWLMLINYYENPAETDVYNDVQLNFYRVIHASKTSDAGVDPRIFTITLQGPDFDLFRDWTDPTKTNGSTSDFGTYAILIPNVLAIYERTIRAEPDSSWRAE